MADEKRVWVCGCKQVIGLWNAVMYRRPVTEGERGGSEELRPRLPLRLWRRWVR